MRENLRSAGLRVNEDLREPGDQQDHNREDRGQADDDPVRDEEGGEEPRPVPSGLLARIGVVSVAPADGAREAPGDERVQAGVEPCNPCETGIGKFGRGDLTRADQIACFR